MKPSIKQILDTYGLAAQRQLSQNFIVNKTLLTSIASLCQPGRQVIEVGPGPGSLSRALLDANPHNCLLAVELDRRFEPALQQIKEAYPGRFEYRLADALNTQDYLTPEVLSSPVSIIGNLPFGIASLLLQRFLQAFDPTTTKSFDHEFLLMFQKEVAMRIVAGAGSKLYGRLSITSQNAHQVDIPLVVPSKQFVPKPKVDAAVVRFKPLATSDFVVPYNQLSYLTGRLFARRNRMLGSILRDAGLSCEGLPVDPERRPPAMSIADLQKLTRWLASTHPRFYPESSSLSRAISNAD